MWYMGSQRPVPRKPECGQLVEIGTKDAYVRVPAKWIEVVVAHLATVVMEPPVQGQQYCVPGTILELPRDSEGRQ